MTNIIPFKAIRPVRDKVQLVASRPFYAYSKKMLSAKLKGNPYTFIHIINPEFHKKNKTKANTPERFFKVKNEFERFLKKGIFIQDEKESLYVYKQTSKKHEFLGIIGGADLKEYENNQIKKHEATLTQRELTFSNYLDIVHFNAEPVLLFHQDNASIDQLLIETSQTRAEYEYTTTDKIKHELWLVDKPTQIKAFQSAFAQLNETYIADGHHRCASSYRFYKSNPKKSIINQHTLAFFISESRMNIMDFNRVVKDLNGYSNDEFIALIKQNFDISEPIIKKIAPSSAGILTMYLNERWYVLSPKPDKIDKEHPIKSIDTQILTELILEPILNITDLKTDKRINFVSGDKGIKGLKTMVDKGLAKVAFALYPVTPNQIINVSNADMIMPPKSTWIEPKMRSGLIIYPLEH